MEESTYWQRIKYNIEYLFKKNLITENYSYKDFCNDFIPLDFPKENPICSKCLCDHPIKKNYSYIHKDNNDDELILGSCCIKKFSTIYKSKRICADCGIKIKSNKDNRCPECKKNVKKIKQEQERYIESCKCKNCGYIKKDSKYKYCFICYKNKLI
jgi:predicted Zn-ribbon and HTH transcriptional regulator